MDTPRRRAALISTAAIALLALAPAPARANDEPPLDEMVHVAGIGEDGYSGDGRDARKARIPVYSELELGPGGVLYIGGGLGDRLRKVNAKGVISTVAGAEVDGDPRYVDSFDVGPDGTVYLGASDGVYRVTKSGRSVPVAQLDLYSPTVAAGAPGVVYATDDDHILKIENGAASTIAGGGTLDLAEADGKPATKADLPDYDRLQLDADSKGNVYLAVDEEAAIRKIDPQGRLTTVVDSTDVKGVAGFDVDSAGNLYFVDSDGAYDSPAVVRRIDQDGAISAVSTELEIEVEHSTDIAAAPDGDVFITAGPRVYRLTTDEATPHVPPAPKAEDLPPGKSRFSGLTPGTVRTVAGVGRPLTDQERQAQIRIRTYNQQEPKRAAVGPDGTLYYTDPDRYRVIAVKPGGTTGVFAGTGEPKGGRDEGPAREVALTTPADVAVGKDGSVYIADAGGNVVREVDPKGAMTTVAGTGVGAEERDETPVRKGTPATEVAMTPSGVAVGNDGSLYIADRGGNRIHKVTPAGKVHTLAGDGERYDERADGHPAKEASLNMPQSIAVDTRGAVYFTEGYSGAQHDPAVRRIDPNGILTTFAGVSLDDTGGGYSGNGGPANAAELNNPQDVAVAPNGTVYIADTHNSRIRWVDKRGVIRTLAGTGETTDSGDDGPAEKAAVDEPPSVAVGPKGEVYILNASGDRIRKVKDGVITTAVDLADAESAMNFGDGKHATDVVIDHPNHVALDPAGTLYVIDDNHSSRLLSASPDGTLDSPLATAGLELEPTAVVTAVAAAPDGTLYFATHDKATRGPIVMRRNVDGTTAAVAGGGRGQDSLRESVPDPDGRRAAGASIGQVTDLAVTPDGTLFIATAPRVLKVTEQGRLVTVASASRPARYGTPRIDGIGVDRKGNLYLAERDAGRVHKVDSSGRKSAVAGNGESILSFTEEHEGGDALEVPLSVSDVAVGSDGSLYLSDFGGIYRVDARDHTARQVYINPSAGGSRGSIPSLAIDTHDNVYFADSGHHRVRVLVRPAEIPVPFPWAAVWTVAGIVAGALLLAGLYLWHRREQAKADVRKMRD